MGLEVGADFEVVFLEDFLDFLVGRSGDSAEDEDESLSLSEEEDEDDDTGLC